MEKDGRARVIPVICRDCNWQDAPIGSLKALPKDGKSIISWSNKDQAFLEITKGIKEIIKTLQPKETEGMEQG